MPSNSNFIINSTNFRESQEKYNETSESNLFEHSFAKKNNVKFIELIICI